ncbi:MAG TPA: APC family permease [Streptosporangiaceae bacterium]|nr:APC family permease [Streptosporangiaceae bacterium]
MSFYDLLFLAAGGVIGSEWMLAGSLPWYSWLIGGLLILVVAAVMVELSTAVPKTGGLVFLPLQSSGPLLATVVAAGVWIFYALSPASQAAAMVKGLQVWWRWSGITGSKGYDLTWRGFGFAMLFLLLITAVNLLGPRLFLRINNVLTAFKILIPLLIIGLLLYAKVHPPSHVVHFAHSTKTPPTNESGITLSSVIYAYLGFQGPLDFAGNVKRRGIGEAARLRRAVYGTVCGSILLYISLQFVVTYIRNRSGGAIAGPSPYTEFARVVAPGWAITLVSFLINLDTVLSPAGTGMVFTYVLTREVAALSRAHLTHRGLQKSKYSVIPLASDWLRKLFGDDRLDVFWLILIVDFIISGISLLCVRTEWSVLGIIASNLALVVYVTPSVTLASLRRLRPSLFPRRRYSILAWASFVSIGVIFYLTGWGLVWQGMAALAVGCLLLFGLPLVARASRWYDAKPYAVQFRQLRTNPAAQSAIILFGYFTVVMLASLASKYVWCSHIAKLSGAILVAVLAVIVFRRLIALSVRYMEEHSPTLPTPVPRAPAIAQSE